MASATLYLSSSHFILACAIVLAICCAWSARRQSRKNSTDVPRLPLPGDTELIWGHERIVFTNDPGKAFRKWIGEVGSTFRMKAAFGAPEILVLGDTEGIAHILHRKIYDYHHSELVRPRVARLLGKGLGWIEGKEDHQRMKRLTSPALSANNLRAMSSHVVEGALAVVNELSDYVHTAGDCARVNLTDWTGKAILNVVGRVAFLHDFQGGNSDEAQQILTARKVGASPVAQFSGFLTLMLLRRFTFLNYLPIAAISGQGLARRTVQSGVAAELIRRNRGLASKDENDLLSRILVASNEEKITNEELYAHISTFMIAGFESSTITLAFTAWELARHPQIQEKLRQEINGLSGELSYDVFHLKMPYLDAVLKETLRLYPGLPYMERIATVPDIIPLKQPIQLSDGTALKQLRVDAGQTVLIPIIALHRLDSAWKDPDEFRPERWLDPPLPDTLISSGWANLLAFSDGARSCIGARLAIFQYKVVLTLLIQRFVFDDAGGEMSLKIASSLQPWVKGKEDKVFANGIPVVLRSVHP